MKTVGFPVLLLCLVLALVSGTSAAQYKEAAIENITADPKKFSSAAVEVTGTATLYAPGATSSTGYYLLKSPGGAAIRVNTSDGAPVLKRRYRVSGIVYLDPESRVPFISEKTRVWMDAPVETPVEAREFESVWWENPMLVLLLIMLIAAPVVFYLRVRRRSVEAPPIEIQEDAIPINFDEDPSPVDLKTVKITLPAPMTMRYVPGELVLVSGDDKGKAFKIAGYPTAEGSIVTIGREEVTGERAYAHIQIDEKFHTVSRKQAELIWKDKKLYVKNLSDTNPTQVNGVELKSGKPLALKPGSTIRTGELEFEYKV